MTAGKPATPSYDELRRRTDAPAGSAWGVHGPDDDIGTINFLTPQALVSAAHAVQRGRIFNLDCALDAFDGLSPHRAPMVHTIHGEARHHSRDDKLDSFYLQCSSQIDGLRHFRHPVYGFYNFTPTEEVAVGTRRLGIQRLAEHGVAGRGVLLDVDRYRRAQGAPLDMMAGEAFGPDLLDAVAKSQNITFQKGDILLIRTGWLRFYVDEASEEDRASLAKKIRCPGLIQSHEMVAWIWDNAFSLCATDTPGVEAVPSVATSPFAAELADVPGVPKTLAAMLHPTLIGMLGLSLGEFWALDELAEDCAADGRYDFLCIAKPLNLTGGVGSPANAMAIK